MSRVVVRLFLVVSVAASTMLCFAAPAVAQPKAGKLERGAHPNQIEGAIWQYKITREKGGKMEKKEGAFRVDNKAIFVKRKRVGDVVTEKDETTLIFTDFDELKGRAFIKRERDTFWKGYYLDEHRERWKFELRRGED